MSWQHWICVLFSSPQLFTGVSAKSWSMNCPKLISNAVFTLNIKGIANAISIRFKIIYTKFAYSETLSNVVIMFLEIILGDGNWLFICPPLGTEQLSSYAFGINRWKGVSIFPSILLFWLLHEPSIILLRFLTKRSE